MNCYPTTLLNLRRLASIGDQVRREFPQAAILFELEDRFILTGAEAHHVGQWLRVGTVRAGETVICEWSSWALQVRVLPWLGQQYQVRIVRPSIEELTCSASVVSTAALLRHPAFSARWVSCLSKQLGLVAQATQLDELEQELLRRRDAYDDRLVQRAGFWAHLPEDPVEWSTA
ncbi:hypothetical protein KLP40_14900 [Hymenobacter sp. NST-14]|uniref:hypothetical protein n=1 Tax=Hymenobacter piscis TaxID=2839984 RepID=UPI001C031DFD|nr:hypothetical protein [Hymenobacter piscis]MBT9394458.1 hypothetical protein [Hymenobacter piscis]